MKPTLVTWGAILDDEMPVVGAIEILVCGCLD